MQDGGETLGSVHLDQMPRTRDELQAGPGYRLGQGMSPVDRNPGVLDAPGDQDRQRQ